MIRVCQMLLAESLKKNEHKLQLSEIIEEFMLEGDFSLNKICEEG